MFLPFIPPKPIPVPTCWAPALSAPTFPHFACLQHLTLTLIQHEYKPQTRLRVLWHATTRERVQAGGHWGCARKWSQATYMLAQLKNTSKCSSCWMRYFAASKSKSGIPMGIL
jgi:hypothetical protein